MIDSLEHLRQRCAATSVPLQNAAESGAAAGVFDLNCGKSSNLVFGTDSRLGISVAIRRLGLPPEHPKDVAYFS